MTFSKNFPRTIKGSNYPIWEEVYLSKDEETEQELKARRENFEIMKECVADAKKIVANNSLKDYQSDVISVAIALFEKRASHEVFHKENKCKEKFDSKVN